MSSKRRKSLGGSGTLLTSSRRVSVGVAQVFNGLRMCRRTSCRLLSVQFTICPAKYKRVLTPALSLVQRSFRPPRQANSISMRLRPLSVVATVRTHPEHSRSRTRSGMQHKSVRWFRTLILLAKDISRTHEFTSCKLRKPASCVERLTAKR